MLSFLCHCGQKIHVPREMAGEQGHCPACRAVLTVPAGTADDAPQKTVDPPSADPGQARLCPACGESIKVVARKCRFCGEILDPSLLAARRVYGAEPAAGLEDRAPGPSSSLARISLVCSLAGLVTCGLLALPGVVMGHLALGQIKRGTAGGAGMATAGLVLGYVTLAVAGLFVLGVILA